MKQERDEGEGRRGGTKGRKKEMNEGKEEGEEEVRGYGCDDESIKFIKVDSITSIQHTHTHFRVVG
jgi:hypothetical protein